MSLKIKKNVRGQFPGGPARNTYFIRKRFLISFYAALNENKWIRRVDLTRWARPHFGWAFSHPPLVVTLNYEINYL